MPVVRGGREVRRKGGPDSLNAVRAGLDQWVSRESGLGGLPAPGGAPCRAVCNNHLVLAAPRMWRLGFGLLVSYCS